MSLDQIPVFSMLRGTMSMLTQRQKLLAENIANADTPGFIPRDVDEKSFQQALQKTMAGSQTGGAAMTATDPLHFQAPGIMAGGGGHGVGIIDTPNSETTLNGNSVVLEEQVSQLADTRMRYDMAIGLYQKSLGLLRLAMKSPGR
ncbi:MAG: flagellar basal body rod protein FlgB [Robiginitomaculum sp.]|nr:MAG: flagellar basal body rod protein FlgB [Robiginitomaculum sp.]